MNVVTNGATPKGELARALRDARTLLHLTQTEVGAKIGTRFETIHKWETGKQLPTLGNLQKLCPVLGLDLPRLRALRSQIRDEAELDALSANGLATDPELLDRITNIEHRLTLLEARCPASPS